VRTADEQYRLCQRCHEAEVAEWQANTGTHSTYRDAYTQEAGCFCHQINDTQLSEEWNLSNVENYDFVHFNASGNVTGKDNWTWRTNQTPHAAMSVLCVDCHQNAADQLSNENSAHREFYNQTRNEPEGSNNTACMACHTMIGLNITMERIKSGIELVANHTNYTAGWTVEAYVNNTERTTNYTYWAPGESPHKNSS